MDAARFSFLLSIPAITGAAILGFKEFGSQSSVSFLSCTVGFAAAFVSGLFALFFLLYRFALQLL